MSNKQLIIGGVIVLGLLVGGGLYWFLQQKGERLPPELSFPPLFSKETKTYEDEAGFSFEYPEDITVVDITPDDDEHYSLLELTSSKQEEKITLRITATDVASIEEWFKEDSRAPRQAILLGATTLADVSAKQYTHTNSTERLLTVAVDMGVVYVIVGPRDKGVWEDVYAKLLSTFAFQKPEEITTQNLNVTYEAEEVVE